MIDTNSVRMYNLSNTIQEVDVLKNTMAETKAFAIYTTAPRSLGGN